MKTVLLILLATILSSCSIFRDDDIHPLNQSNLQLLNGAYSNTSIDNRTNLANQIANIDVYGHDFKHTEKVNVSFEGTDKISFSHKHDGETIVKTFKGKLEGDYFLIYKNNYIKGIPLLLWRHGKHTVKVGVLKNNSVRVKSSNSDQLILLGLFLISRQGKTTSGDYKKLE